MTEVAGDAAEEGEATLAAAAWPKKLAAQVVVVRDLVQKSSGEWTAAKGAKAFAGAKPTEVGEVMDALAAVGVLAGYGDGRARKWRAVG